MPGMNHEFEANFLDELPPVTREAAASLLQFYRLRQLMDMRQFGPDKRMSEDFDLTPSQWNQVLDAVILTKVSYFVIDTSMPPKYIKKLLDIAGWALEEPETNLQQMKRLTQRNYPFFYDWLKKVESVQHEYLRMARKRGMI
ncbi:hypothetical protein [Hydrogenovibrio halophilus]|uniref:hypothetical protein n=1 Tax=Hydrogenovibrio halophilus TaxID=373391 RepID=UPI00039F89B5|nr:hypothetical protein [Hydrogenovibrio halophilus]